MGCISQKNVLNFCEVKGCQGYPEPLFDGFLRNPGPYQQDQYSKQKSPPRVVEISGVSALPKLAGVEK